MRAKAKRDTRNDLNLFDIITREKRDEEGSVWKGDRGIYIIRHLEPKAGGRKSPIAKVILNHHFLTGIFASRRSDVFTGDIKQDGHKKFMLFKVIDAARMEVHIQK